MGYCIILIFNLLIIGLHERLYKQCHSAYNTDKDKNPEKAAVDDHGDELPVVFGLNDFFLLPHVVCDFVNGHDCVLQVMLKSARFGVFVRQSFDLWRVGREGI